MKKQSSNLFSEIASYYLDYMKTSNKVPFDAIFGNKLRTIEPLYGKSSYQKLLKDLLGDQYEIDFEKWAGYKISDIEKKNPNRLGKILTKRKETLTKTLSSIENEEQKRKLEINIKALDDLLKTTNLQKQYEQANPTADYVIYSRSPIDVARMSDFDWKSCHTPGNNYFYCALSDSRNLGAIAYLVSEEEYQTYELHKDENLQKQEIFKDNDRNLKGINPQARIRIRLVNDSAGNELAVPNLKVYAPYNKRYNSLFIQQVTTWAKKQDVSDFNWDNGLTLRGGNYEDSGHDVKENIKKIWGKNIQYVTKKSDYDELRSEFGPEEDDDRLEQLLDDIRENINDDILNEVWSRLTDEEYDLSSNDEFLDITMGRTDIEVKIKFPKVINDFLVQNNKNEEYMAKIQEKFQNIKKYDERIRISLNDFRGNYHFNVVANFPLYYENLLDEEEAENFNFSRFYDKCAAISQKVINVLTGNLTTNYKIKNQHILPLKITENLFDLFEVPFINDNEISASQMIEEMNIINGIYSWHGIELGKYEFDMSYENVRGKLEKLRNIKLKINDYIFDRIYESLPKLTKSLATDKLDFLFNLKSAEPDSSKLSSLLVYKDDDKNFYSRNINEDYIKKLAIKSADIFFVVIPHAKDDIEKSYINVFYSHKGLDQHDLQELLVSPDLKDIYNEYKKLENQKEIEKIIDSEKIKEIIKQSSLEESSNWKTFLKKPKFKLFWEMKNNIV